MILSQANILSEGAFSDVFFGEDKTRVFKLFVAPGHRQKGYPISDEARRRKTFKSEYDAYVIASKDLALSSHIPVFHGALSIDDVVDRDGASVRDHYLLDSCYQMERIVSEPPTKFGSFMRESHPHLYKTELAFFAAGIRHVRDSSVFFGDDIERFTFIDFATEEFELIATNLW